MNNLLQLHLEEWNGVYKQDDESEYAFNKYMEAVELSKELFGDGQNFNVIKSLIRIVVSETEELFTEQLKGA